MSNTELGDINTAATGGVTPVQTTYDNNGSPPTSGLDYQGYSYAFTATASQDYISFLFRNDPGYSYLDTVKLTVHNGNTNLLTDGGFDSGPQASPNQTVPVGWSAINAPSLTSAGAISTNLPQAGTYDWQDGAVGGYDGLDQGVALTVGTTYTLSFELAVAVDTSQGSPDTNGDDNGIDTQVWVGPSAQSGSVACYLSGTRLRAARRDVEVDALVPGMRIHTLTGELLPILWIGRRRYLRHRVAAPFWRAVAPVRIRRHAIADGVPSRHLLVSQDHSLFLAGHLVPARLLVNGTTITLDTTLHDVEYFHVELARHEVILAENTPAETYLEDGNRHLWMNAEARAGRRGTAPTRDDEWYGPRILGDHPVLTEIRAGLARRARDLCPRAA
jgi:hypothetical protein